MENFLRFDEVMELGCASEIEQIEVFQAIKEEDVEVVEQVGGGHAAVLVMVEEGHQFCAASSSRSQRNVPRLEGEAITLPYSINVGDCIEFLTSLLEQHGRESPCQNKIWTKKMLHLIAKEIQVLPPRNQSIIKNDDEDIISNWKSYVEALIKELRIVHNRGFHVRNLGVYVLTDTPYALILEMVVEML